MNIGCWVVNLANERNLRDVATLLSQSLGQVNAELLVRREARVVGFRGEMVTRDQALVLLEHLAKQRGIVGITARFAMARLHLVWPS